VSDITERVGRFDNQFDLIVCYQVLEHVRPLDRAFENMRSYLRPDGRVLAVFSGRFSIFGLVNLLVPRPIVLWGGRILLGRDPTSVFPAVYHRCWYSALERMLAGFSKREIMPFYEAAAYLRFSRFLQGLFLGYEEWTWLKKHRNLASHYLVNAVA
jgi:SAM-dependent methyltransferase